MVTLDRLILLKKGLMWGFLINLTIYIKDKILLNNIQLYEKNKTN
jgi:hypothetical protein